MLRPHTVETEDGYLNTIFTIEKESESESNTDSQIIGSVLLHHGSTMDGLSWFDTEHESLPS